MLLRSLLPAVALATLLVGGCSTAPTSVAIKSPPAAPTLPAASVIPAARTDLPPAAPVDARPASIKGSEESSTLLDNFTAFVVAVDDQPVAAGRKGWSQPFSLAPGQHRLTVEFNRGSFFARTDLTLDAKPGARYELRQANDAQVYGQHAFCEFWIVDQSTGQPVVAPKRVALDKLKTGG